MLKIAPIFIEFLKDFRAEGRMSEQLIEISMKIAQKWRRRGRSRWRCWLRVPGPRLATPIELGGGVRFVFYVATFNR